MRLKRLELFGFKSFADRTVLDFENTVVGIVGPNGCGKSNVVDGVRWVLGEQRASSMRGGEMADVIFKGSASRPALAMAEVTMVLDNACDSLEGRGAEVAITRRVFKSGEGEYLIDGERVRLKDVREMLYGTGLGSRGYAFLEQGKIDAVLSANAVERRTIFEEAAGISRYRQRIKETASKLQRVEADLLRLDDVLGELEKRERSLKIQAGRAQRFLEAREQWTREGLRHARHALAALRAEARAQAAALAALEGEADTCRRARSDAERDAGELARSQEEAKGEVERLGAQARQQAEDLRALDERVAELGARVEAWRESAAEELERARGLEERLAERAEQAAALRAEVERAGQEAARAEAQASELEEARRGAQQACDGARAALERANASVLELLDARTSWKNRVQHLAELQGPLGERAARARERGHEARAAADEASAQARSGAERLESERAAHEALAAERAALEQELARRAGRVRELDAARAEAELEVARLASRQAALLDWEREREGLERGSRGLLEGVADERLQLSGQVLGLVADHLRADSSLARALDAALAARAQALVLSAPEDAARALAWLKQGELGRASLVVAGSLAPGAELGAASAELLAEPGVEGALVERIQVEPGYEALARVCLADVVLVRDLAQALELVARHPRARCVTREGDLIDAAGLDGGHIALAQGPVGRRSHAADLAQERARVGQELERLEHTIAAERALEASERARLAQLAERCLAGERELARLRGEVEAAQGRRAELERSLEHFEREESGLSAELERAEGDLVEARRRDQEAEQRFGDERRRLEQLERERGALEERREALASEAQRARLEARAHHERLQSLELREREREHECAQTGLELERARRLAGERSASADAGERERDELRLEREGLLAQRTLLEEELAAARERERTGTDSLQLLRQRGETITEELEKLLARVADGRLAHQRIELAIEELARRVEEDFALSCVRLLEGFEPEAELLAPDGLALAALAERVAALKGEMDRCGPVNLEAVDELAEVAQRLGFMGGQRADLEQAKRALQGTIEKLNVESERRFVETFEQVRTSFRAIFRQLFGGGNADILLLDQEHVLDSGLEIVARPPGRESLPISLLSGGQRTMTALALLFAVFRAQPSPFCVLDEVDAALDDANIGRFLSLLSGTELGSQFLIVTHNKGTMSACHSLYGVTMAVRGVSHVVSVELSDVDDFVPEATGAAQVQGAAPRPASAPREADGHTLVPFRPSQPVEAEAVLAEREDAEVEVSP